MSEKEITNFDRNIEQMMNEHAVAPPFGMWNRIAAELDGPVAAVAPAKPLFSRGIVIGFIAGALVIGSAITGILIYNGNVAPKGISNTATAPATNKVTLPVLETASGAKVAAGIVEEAKIATAQKSEVGKAVAKADKVGIAQPVAITAIVSNNNDVAAPDAPIGQNSSKVEEAYYFPPVDITMGIEKPAAGHVKPATKAAIADKDDEDDDKDNKRKISSSNGERVKFRPKKKSKFSYGRINKYKKY